MVHTPGHTKEATELWELKKGDCSSKREGDHSGQTHMKCGQEGSEIEKEFVQPKSKKRAGPLVATRKSTRIQDDGMPIQARAEQRTSLKNDLSGNSNPFAVF